MIKGINRGKVHVITNEQGKIFSITEEGRVKVSIRQIEMHITEEGYHKEKVKDHYMEGPMELLNLPIQKGSILPGNIHIIQQTEPFNDDDHMEGLLWNGDTVVRTDDGKAIYEVRWYNEHEEFEPQKQFDTFLVSL